MKKILLLLVAIMLMAGTVYAGGGNGGDWYTDPVIIPGNPFQPLNPRNESYITQKGQFSWAMVTQMGDESKSVIYQDTRYGKDTATVLQKSDCCYLFWFPLYTQKAYQNFSKIKQTGFGWHDAFVYQDGDGNKSNIRQSGKMDKAEVKQEGGFNESVIEQSGYDINKAYVTQIGDMNSSYIKQCAGIDTATVTQNGFGNVSAIYQDGYCAINTALVNQSGYLNLSKIYQGSNGMHTAIVTQLNDCFTAKVQYCTNGGCR